MCFVSLCSRLRRWGSTAYRWKQCCSSEERHIHHQPVRRARQRAAFKPGRQHLRRHHHHPQRQQSQPTVSFCTISVLPCTFYILQFYLYAPPFTCTSTCACVTLFVYVPASYTQPVFTSTFDTLPYTCTDYLLPVPVPVPAHVTPVTLFAHVPVPISMKVVERTCGCHTSCVIGACHACCT
jgi:hypothetical protein